MSYDIETARQLGQGFKQAMGMSDEEFEEHISYGFNRRLMEHLDEMTSAKIVAEVVEAKYCLAGCQVGQKFVLQCTPAMLLPEESTCPLCSKAIGPVAEQVNHLWDLMSHGLDPNDGQPQFVSCLDGGITYGGLGNVKFKLRVEKAAKAS
jgi:uncharacterized repeat protein (TIGR04076 family)